jgi:hypothetical protein
MKNRVYLSLLSSVLVSVVALTDAAPTLFGSYRKDYYLKKYREALSEYPVPLDGGRVHLVLQGSACNGSAIKSVKVNGQEAMNLPFDPSGNDDPDFTYFDWSRIHHDEQSNVAWMSFHSRNRDWLDSSGSPKLSVDVSDDGGKCFSGKVTVSPKPSVLVTYATTRNDGMDFVVHFQNNRGSSVTLSSYTINGQIISNRPITVEANGTHIANFTQATRLAPGRIWSVALPSENVAWGGRVIPEVFPIEVWPYSEDCPVVGAPGAQKTAVSQIQDLGIDTVFLTSHHNKCGDPSDVADALAEKDLPMSLLLQTKFIAAAKNRSKISGAYIGDEVDGSMGSNLRTTDPVISNKNWPEIPTFQGGKTNGHIGSYSGITDVQGMDAYIGACAPTIVPVIDPLPIAYPYLYLKNTRDNHMPLPTWLYSQFYSHAWSYQAHGPEIAAQMAMTVLAGGKGVTLFQSEEQMITDQGSAQLAPIKRVLTTIKALRETFRQGTIGGATVQTSAKGNVTLHDAIRTPDKLVFVVLNTNAKGYSNLLCHIYITGTHWKFSKQTVDSFQLQIPSGLKLSNFAEQIGDKSDANPSGVDTTVKGNTVVLNNMALDDVNPVRFFTFDISK